MHNAVLVRILQRLANRIRDVERFFDGLGAGTYTIGECRTLDQFHHQPRPVRIFKPVDARDIRMIERREYLGFALKAIQSFGISRDVRWQDFDRNRAA